MIDATTPEFITFLTGVQAKVDARFVDYAPRQAAKVEVEVGPKNIRVINALLYDGKDVGQRSVHCFVSRETGDILKDAGWKGPVKGAVRGNIFAADNGLSCVTGYGCAYLR